LHTTASVLSQITFHQGHACSAHNNRIQHDLLQLFFNLEFLLSELQVFEWLQEKLRSRRANTPNTEGFLEKEIINYVHRLYVHEESCKEITQSAQERWDVPKSTLQYIRLVARCSNSFHKLTWYVYLNQYSRQAASSLASRNSIFPRFWFP
jgi:hypothetical protein